MYPFGMRRMVTEFEIRNVTELENKNTEKGIVFKKLKIGYPFIYM